MIWFGALQTVDSPTDTPMIRVYAAPLRRRPIRDKLSNAKFGGDFRTAQIPVGEAACLHLNAILRDGELVYPWDHQLPSERRETEQRLDFSAANVRLIRRDHQENGESVISLPRRVLPDDPEAGGYFLAVGDGDDPFAILIRCYEIARFFYMHSSRLANLLPTSAYISPYQHLFDPTRTRLDRDSGHMVLQMRQRMLDADAQHVAWLAADPLYLLRAAEIFLQSSSTQFGKDVKQIIARPP